MAEIGIGGTLVPKTTDGVGMKAENVKDTTLRMMQSEINAETNDSFRELGYYVCDTAADVRDKVVTSHIADGHRQGLSQKVKMTYATTVVSRYVHNGAAHGLYFEGKIANAENSWNAGDILEIFCDGANAYAKVWNSESIRLNTLQQKTSEVEKETIEEDANEDITIENRSGEVVAKITATDCDFKNLKSNGVEVVTDLSGTATKDDLELLKGDFEKRVSVLDEMSRSKTSDTTDAIEVVADDDTTVLLRVTNEGVYAKNLDGSNLVENIKNI